MMSSFKQLIKRRVFQTVAIYVAIAWGSLEIISWLVETLRPDFASEARLYLAAVFIAGFPVAIAFAWSRDIASLRLRMLLRGIALVVFVIGAILVYRQGREPGPPYASLAVFPFVDHSPTQNESWLVDGLSADIRNTLAQTEGLIVIAETSSSAVRGIQETDIAAIRNSLNVRHILDGSVRRSDDALRVVANLVDTTTGRHVWSQAYDLAITNIFDVQVNIAQRIAGALKVQLAPHAMDGGTDNIEAYEAAMRATYAEDRQTRVLLLEEAIKLDPAFAAAYIDLAAGYYFDAWGGHTSPQEAWAEAEPLLEKATEIDSRLPHIYLVYGHHYERIQNYRAAEENYKYALELNPNFDAAYRAYGLLLRWALGRYEEAVHMHERNVIVDPLNHHARINLGSSYWQVGRFDDAKTQYDKAIQLNPEGRLVYESYAGLYIGGLGRFDEGIRIALDTLATMKQFSPRNILIPGTTFSRLGDTENALLFFNTVQTMGPNYPRLNQDLAMLHWRLGNKTVAAEYADRTLEVMPINPLALQVLRNIDLEAGEFEKAIARYRDAAPELFNDPPATGQWRTFLAVDLALVLAKASDMHRADRLLNAVLDSLKPYTARQYELIAAAHAIRGRSDDTARALRPVARAVMRPDYCVWLPIDPTYERVIDSRSIQSIIAESCTERDRQLANIRRMLESGEIAIPDIVLGHSSAK